MEDGLSSNTAYQDLATVFAQLIRVGIVMNTNPDKRLATVKFPDLGYTSDWLPVVISQDVFPDHKYTDPQWTDFESEDEEQQAGVTAYVRHRHKLIVKPYMPIVGDQVLALYQPIRDGQGFILGGIQKWQ